MSGAGEESGTSSPNADYSGESELDDETTIAEAEAANASDEEDELADLEADQDLPIEELMRRYYGDAPPDPPSQAPPKQQSLPSATKTPNHNQQQQPPAKETVPTGPQSNGEVSVPNPHGYFGEYAEESDSEDGDYQPPELWRKEIRVGDEFQASIPVLLSSDEAAASARTEEALATLLWRPGVLSDAKVEAYLRAVYTLLMAKGAGEGLGSPISVPPPTKEASEASAAEVAALEAQLGLDHEAPPAKRLRQARAPLPQTPNGFLRDDEDALHLLLARDLDAEAALREEGVLEASRWRHSLGRSPDLRLAALESGAEPRPGLWSAEEASAFEEALRREGKNFLAIAREPQLQRRTLADLVEFYYAWKKSERHDVFTARNRVLKRHYHLHPDASDYMEHLLDQVEGGPPTVRGDGHPFSPPPSHHIVLGGTAFAKPPLPNSATNPAPVPNNNAAPALPIIDSRTVQEFLPE